MKTENKLKLISEVEEIICKETESYQDQIVLLEAEISSLEATVVELREIIEMMEKEDRANVEACNKALQKYSKPKKERMIENG